MSLCTVCYQWINNSLIVYDPGNLEICGESCRRILVRQRPWVHERTAQSEPAKSEMIAALPNEKGAS